MRAHEKPTFSFSFNVDAEIERFRQHMQQEDRRIPARKSNNLLIATWNLTNFGLQKRQRKHLQLMASIIEPFDVVAVQELADDLDHFDGLVAELGSDWDYYYTGQPGLTLPGLGWVRSYMYDSFGIVIYHEIDRADPAVRCAVIKCVRAGWGKINVVKKIHIYKGLQRFSKSFKEIMESPRLPDEKVLTRVFSEIRNLPVAALQSRPNPKCRHDRCGRRREMRSRSPRIRHCGDDKPRWSRESKAGWLGSACRKERRTVAGPRRAGSQAHGNG